MIINSFQLYFQETHLMSSIAIQEKKVKNFIEINRTYIIRPKTKGNINVWI